MMMSRTLSSYNVANGLDLSADDKAAPELLGPKSEIVDAALGKLTSLPQEPNAFPPFVLRFA